MDNTNLHEVLLFLSTGGAAVITTALVSYLAEHWPWFQAQSSEAKKWLSVAVSLGIGLAAWGTVTYAPADVLAQLEAPFRVVMLSILTLLGGQAWHKLTKS